ncbi:hypothetical protein C7374_102198 [Falsochrobactrum ovis]|uniref:Uncharacterized protein n=1 Tax=Falsochrobactrum ovis TaxID=1293442 RepID=A0A364JY26_9HYPH|nr:hypothetical protein C7374_102198 [Falsochrobactrum ovis]
MTLYAPSTRSEFQIFKYIISIGTIEKKFSQNKQARLHQVNRPFLHVRVQAK